MASSDQAGGSSSSLGLFIENIIIIQYDPQVQEIWDQARKLRCTWYDFYEKAVSFRPFNVDMVDAVTANFLGDNIQCWMQIQVGKGPWASEVAGIVKIGQTMTMVLAIKDEENKFDMLVRNCVAHDGKNQPIQLVDEFGCIMRPKIMSKFQKVKNFGHSATVVSYAYFQAFKFPDSMSVHFQCVIQVCRHECPPPACENDMSLANDLPELAIDTDRKFSNRLGDIPLSQVTVASTNLSEHATNHSPVAYAIHSTGGMPRALDLNKLRRKRDVPRTDVNTQKVIQVVAPGDVAFNLPLYSQNTHEMSTKIDLSQEQVICMSTAGFAVGLAIMLLMLIVTCIVTVFLVIKLRKLSVLKKDTSLPLNYQCTNHPTEPCSCSTPIAASTYYLQVPIVASTPSIY